MVKLKMLFALLFVLLVTQDAAAVVNKASQAPISGSEEAVNKNEIKADDRISNSYGLPADDYAPPAGLGFNGPAPVYGPPELVGDHGPTPIYPPPPPDLPPPVFDPIPAYGPPRGPKPSFVLPKPDFGLPSFAPGKLHLGPPKHLGPPFALLRPKPQYGPPKFGQLPLINLPPVSLSKPGHGPPIPISIEAYGPPPLKQIVIPFNTSPPKNEYGPPLQPLPLPQAQYGPPAGDIYGPPPPGPPPGVPAPPTPPDIKYDGWQPIAGLATPPNHQPSEAYGPPNDGSRHHHISSQAVQSHLSIHSQSSHSSNNGANHQTQNSNVPSDSYGVPIHNPEAQNLKSSVHESSSSSESNGLPPPKLPQYEPLHNEQGPTANTGSHGSSGNDERNLVDHINLQFGLPNSDPVAIIKTVGFELLPTGGSLTSGLQGSSPSANGHGLASYDQLSNTFNVDSVAPLSLPTLQLPGFSGGDDLSLQQLPVHGADNFGASLSTDVGFRKPSAIVSGIPLPPPPPADSYGTPPLSSYAPNGPYPGSQSGRGHSSFPSFGLVGSSFHKYNGHHHHHHRHVSSFRPPQPLGNLIPPRNREPIKFREPIPTGLLTTLNRFVPPAHSKPLKSFGHSSPFGQQLPSLNAPLSFHQQTLGGNSFSSFNGGSSKIAGLHSPIAAPHVQYGTPLSFTDFNTPAPILTYGAPNFGPATSFVSSSHGFGNGNLYDNVGNTLTTTYGTPVVNGPSSIGDCGFSQPSVGVSVHNDGGSQPLGPLSFEKTGSHESLHSGNGFAGSLPAFPGNNGNGKQHQEPHFEAPALTSVSNSLHSTYDAPSVNQLDLQNYDQQKTNLKDSYGNPVGLSYNGFDQGSGNLSKDHVYSSTSGITNVISLSPSSQATQNGLFQFEKGISAEALTASLTEQGFGRTKNLASEVDASQYLKTDEGSRALALAQGLTADSDSFQIQGSKGTYMLQIQAADGGLGTENSDGTIRHEQVLSDGLLQDILAAIEQPHQGHVEFQGPPQAQSLEEVYGDLARSGSAHGGHYILKTEAQKKSSVEHDRQEEKAGGGKNEAIALFFDNKYVETMKETRSASKNGAAPPPSAKKNANDGKAKSS